MTASNFENHQRLTALMSESVVQTMSSTWMLEARWSLEGLPVDNPDIASFSSSAPTGMLEQYLIVVWKFHVHKYDVDTHYALIKL